MDLFIYDGSPRCRESFRHHIDRGSIQESWRFDEDVFRNRVAHKITDEEARILGDVPEAVPDFLLKKTLLMDGVTTDPES